MIEGLHRSDTPYLWPTSLVFGVGGGRSIYLDLNHWIGLAKADVGHRDGSRYEELLHACRLAVKRGDAVFPYRVSTTWRCPASATLDNGRTSRG